jgi:hypothetical protein
MSARQITLSIAEKFFINIFLQIKAFHQNKSVKTKKLLAFGYGPLAFSQELLTLHLPLCASAALRGIIS